MTKLLKLLIIFLILLPGYYFTLITCCVPDTPFHFYTCCLFSFMPFSGFWVHNLIHCSLTSFWTSFTCGWAITTSLSLFCGSLFTIILGDWGCCCCFFCLLLCFCGARLFIWWLWPLNSFEPIRRLKPDLGPPADLETAPEFDPPLFIKILRTRIPDDSLAAFLDLLRDFDGLAGAEVCFEISMVAD